MCSSERESDMTDRVPAFLRKLWKIVENPETDSMIRWSNEGKSFIVLDASEFVKVMPLWYKHGNMASFIRQLNMYGFRKVVTLDNGMTSGNTMEYSHPHFVKSCPSLIENIRRLVRPKRGSVPVGQVLSQLQEASSAQEMLSAQLQLMRSKHVQLASELEALRKVALARNQPDSAAGETLSGGADHSAGSPAGPTPVGSTAGAELGGLLAREARARLDLVELQRSWMAREHALRVRELELCVGTEKARAEREAAEWSLCMRSRDQKLANLRLGNDILREELRLLHH
ncbi:heat shock factor protein-like [Bacillus rossius redtenbacheri]|uniref:heat shock factor protein-like n=1 Tax=Bacillus rossius redtenbacheri TaxID=93214 RepID=UPI002FDE52EA